MSIKWVVAEVGTEAALRLLHCDLHAPDWMMAECTNVLWKKVRRRELQHEEAPLALALLCRSSISLHASGALLPRSLELGILLDHPVYDCLYLALAERLEGTFVTADERLFNKLPQGFRVRAVTLRDCASSVL